VHEVVTAPNGIRLVACRRTTAKRIAEFETTVPATISIQRKSVVLDEI
jgi:hypothetical protein